MNKILKHLLWIVPLIIIIGIFSLVAYAATARRADTQYHSRLRKTIQISSDSFQHEQQMPLDFTCRGRGIAPHLHWTGAPENTKSYALITMDWDAPSPRLRLFEVVHWILYNIPPNVSDIPQNSTNASLARRRIVAGLNIGRQPGYMAPCPPIGTHRYAFRLYALDVDQIQPASNDKTGIMTAMNGHILAYGELVGLNKP